MNLETASKKYFEALPSDFSDNSIRLYKYGISMFVDTVGNKEVSEVDESDFTKFCQSITRNAKSLKWTARTQHAYTRGVIGLLTYLAENRLSTSILPQALWRTRKNKIAKIHKKPYTPPKGIDAFPQKVYDTPLPPKEWRSYQRFLLEHAFVSAIVSSGARIHEICKLRAVDFEGNRTIVRGKGGKYGYVNFTNRAMKIINRWLNERDASSPYLFPAIRDGKNKTPYISTETGRKIIYRWLVILLGDKGEITPHDFRHLMIAKGIRAMGLRWAQKAARHSNPETTADYDDSDADEISQKYDEAMEAK